MNRLCIVSLSLVVLLCVGCEKQANTSALFTEVSRSRSGIDFRNLLKEDENFNIFKYQYFNNGGGVAAGDFNNDGLQDLVFTGNMVKNRLYINQGDMRFEDVTKQSRIAEKEGWCTGVTTVDINADGWLDIYICRAAYPFDDLRSNLLFINNGDLTFTEQAAEYGIDDLAFSTHSAFFDYDLDGDLDLFLLNHSTVEYSREALEVFQLRNKKNPNFTNKLFRNDNGQFVNVTEQAGIYSNVLTFSLGISVSDIDNDGWPDLFIGNDFNEPDYLFINQKDGTFSDAAADSFDHMAMFSMGSDIADVNNDGLVDIASLDMLPRSNFQQKMHSGADNYEKVSMLAKGGFLHQSSRNMLQLNNGDGSFSEIGQFAGVSNTNWSWAPLFFDFDNDGNKDLFIANGYPKDHTDMDFLTFTANEVVKINEGGDAVDFDGYMEKMPAILLPNYFYQNDGNLQFTDQAEAWGLDDAKISQSAAYADLDNDGDLDLVLNNTGDYATLYQNNAQALNNHYLRIQLEGEAGNPQGIGSKVYLHAGDKLFFQEQQTVRGFQSTVDPVLHFGLGNITRLDSIAIITPKGRRIVLQEVELDQKLNIRLADAQEKALALSTTTLFEERNLIRFRHEENTFNDFKIQSLLPWSLSRQGPALALGDINGDGLDDLYTGNAKGALGSLWMQQNDGRLLATALDNSNSDIEETAAVIFDANGDGHQDLYLGSGSYEFETGDVRLKDRLYLNSGNGTFSLLADALPFEAINTNCVATTDIDKDGDIDLFIGGGYRFGHYPESYPSQLLLNDGTGHFQAVTVTETNVNDAIWADMNGDGQEELLTLGEWTSLQVFSFQDGKMEDQTSRFLPEVLKGMWNSLIAADFDGDGDLDVAAGNLGANSQLSATNAEPLELYAGDFDKNGSVDPLLFYYIDGQSWPFASRDDLINQLPGLKRKFLFFKDYAKAGLTDILSPEDMAAATHYQAHTLESTYFENQNGQLTARPLPSEAQWAPVHAMAPMDVNQDGHLDLVMAGNTLQAKVKLGRMDSNHGLVLLGDGKGAFEAIHPRASGLNVSGKTSQLAVLEKGGDSYLIFARNDDSLVSCQLK